jgi:hypothetical protein
MRRILTQILPMSCLFTPRGSQGSIGRDALSPPGLVMLGATSGRNRLRLGRGNMCVRRRPCLAEQTGSRSARWLAGSGKGGAQGGAACRQAGQLALTPGWRVMAVTRRSVFSLDTSNVSARPVSVQCVWRDAAGYSDFAQVRSEAGVGQLLLLFEGGGSVYDYGIKIAPVAA